MTFKAQIIADSINPVGDRITTFILTYPRIIHSEFLTHRAFSKNSASSRAIPFEKMVKAVDENPFIPIAWQKDHRGMQGTEYFTDEESITLKEEWLEARNWACGQAEVLNARGATKQLCNRLLEPFMWHTVICTATDYFNFFELRCPRYSVSGDDFYHSRKDLSDIYPDHTHDWVESNWRKANKGQAEIHMMRLAEMMWDAYNESQPKKLKEGEWHIPYSDDLENLPTSLVKDEQQISTGLIQTIQDIQVKIATARCARVSYTIVGEEGKIYDYDKDIKLHDNLILNKHLSPTEHCAMALNESRNFGNFVGFKQYRKFIE